MNNSQGVYPIGCFKSTDTDINTGLFATEAGEHTLSVYIGRFVYSSTFTVAAELDEIIFANPFPESGTFLFDIKMPSGDMYTMTSGSKNIEVYSADIFIA